MHALDRPVPWLFMQLPRFDVREGAIWKTSEPYLLTGAVRLPVFREPGTLGITWHDYAITSYIRHHGPTPASGHYTALLYSAPPYLLDDDQVPRKASDRELEDTSVSTYILVLGDASMMSTSTHASQSFGSSLAAPARHMLETGSSVPHMRRMRETWLSSHQEFQEVWIRRLTMDVQLLQQRLDRLEELIQRLLLPMPQAMAVPGRNKVMSQSMPSELDILDD